MLILRAGDGMSLLNFRRLVPAPGLAVEKVTNSDVIETYHQVLHSLLVAYQEVIGGDPVDAITVVQTKVGEWMISTTKSKKFRKFQAPTLNEIYLNAFDAMGTEVAQDIGIRKEYDEAYSNLNTELDHAGS